MNDVLASSLVAISTGHAGYPTAGPYCPAAHYPEYPFAGQLSDRPNPAYKAVRDALSLLGLDADNFQAERWNPLGQIVKPGNMVVLKPNFVRDFRETRPGHDDCVITHGAIIRAVLDYVYIALKGKGRIVIADAPQNDADFQAIGQIAALDQIQQFYDKHAQIDLKLYDLRPQQAVKIDGIIVGHQDLPGDPAGYVRVNLGLDSAFAEVNRLCHLLYGSEYDTAEIRSHHHDDVHEYLIAKTIIDADVIISLPKLKTHKKTGITVNMKNLVGINGNKNWLPHHRQGTPAQGGDQFCDNRLSHKTERVVVEHFKRLFPLLGPFRRLLAAPAKAIGKKLFGDTNKDTIRSGNWYGNDTTWRMVIDLNRIALYADGQGRMHQRPVRRFFSVVDGIVGGQGNGPLDPTPKRAGVVLAGINPVAVDLASAAFMGFDYRALPVLARTADKHRFALTSFQLQDVVCRSNDQQLNGPISRCKARGPAFEPHFGWAGHIELTERTDEVGTVT